MTTKHGLRIKYEERGPKILCHFCKIYETWGELHFGPVSLLLHKSLKAVIELDSYDLAQKLGLCTQVVHIMEY